MSTGEIERVAAFTHWVPHSSGIVRMSSPDCQGDLRLLLYTDAQT